MTSAQSTPAIVEKKGITASKPPSSFEGLRREIDRIFDGFSLWPPFGREPFNAGFVASAAPAVIAPAVDVIENDGEFKITAELPSLDEKEVEVKVSGDTLSIKGEKKEEKEINEKDYYLSERRYGSFLRSFSLPDGIEADKIEARFDKGILTVRIPKSAQQKKAQRKIEIKTA